MRAGSGWIRKIAVTAALVAVGQMDITAKFKVAKFRGKGWR